MSNSIKILLVAILVLFGAAVVWKNTSSGTENSADAASKKRIASEKQFWNYLNTAEELRLDGELREAEPYYKKALQIKQEHAGALYYLGSIQLFLKDFEQAEENWRVIVDNDPSVARAWLQLGKLYFCRDASNRFYDPVRAQSHFQKAAALNRENTGPPLHLAKIAILKNDLQKAEEYLDGIVAQNFKSYEGFFLKGYVDWKNGNEQSAVEAFQNAADVYSSGNQTKVSGEGATKTGSNPMVSEGLYCDFMKRSIDSHLRSLKDIPASEDLYEEFDCQIMEWAAEI